MILSSVLEEMSGYIDYFAHRWHHITNSKFMTNHDIHHLNLQDITPITFWIESKLEFILEIIGDFTYLYLIKCPLPMILYLYHSMESEIEGLLAHSGFVFSNKQTSLHYLHHMYPFSNFSEVDSEYLDSEIFNTCITYNDYKNRNKSKMNGIIAKTVSLKHYYLNPKNRYKRLFIDHFVMKFLNWYAPICIVIFYIFNYFGLNLFIISFFYFIFPKYCKFILM